MDKTAAPAVPYPKALARFPVLRQSTLATFDECALLSHFDTSLRRGTSSHPQGRGRLFHKFASEAIRAMQLAGSNRIAVGAAFGILEDVLTQDHADRECPHCRSGNIRPGLTKLMQRTCGDCGGLFETEFVNVPMREQKDLYMAVKKWASDNVFDIDRVVDVEKRLSHAVHYSVGGLGVDRALTGQPDVLMLHPDSQRHMVVLDWKDTWMLPPKSELSEEGYFQQRFYAFLVLHAYKMIDGVTLREFYVRKSQVREATIWRHDLDHLDATFSALAQRFDRAFEEQAFLPTPGKHCNYCIRPQKCPIPVFTRGPGRITDERRAKQVAAQLLVAKRVVEKSEKELKGWCEVNGTVEVKSSKGRRVYGFVDRTRTDRPDERVIEQAILENGGALTGPQLKALYKTSVSTTFTDHAPVVEVEEGSEDERLLQSLATSIQRAAERRGVA